MTATFLDSPAHVHRAVTLRYGLSLIALALLSILGWRLMTAQLAEHRRQDETVSMAGAQRMLTHQMAGLAAESLGHEDSASRSRIIANLHATEQRFVASFRTLTEGSKGRPPASGNSPELRAAYFDGADCVNAATAKIVAALSALEAGRLARSDAEGLVAWMRGPLIRSLDRAVTAQKQVAKRALLDLRFDQAADLVAMLLVLVFEAAFVFAPLARRLARQTTEMQRQSRVLIETSQELERLASTDGLTRLANRRALDSALAGSASRVPERPRHAHARPAAATGVISFDLDCFKQVNDVYGHAAGDAVLRAVGERLRAVCRSGDLVARMGGDEFTAILYDVPSSEFVEAIADRIRARVAEPVLFEGVSLSVGASIGTCLVPDQAASLPEAFKIADDMQREAKQQGKSREIRRRDAVGQPVSRGRMGYAALTAWPEAVR